MLRRKRSDANQARIVDALRRIGCSVLILSSVGDGAPDLCVALAGRTVLFEVKNPARRNKDKARNAGQREFRETWRGECYVVESEADALELITRPGGGRSSNASSPTTAPSARAASCGKWPSSSKATRPPPMA